MMEASDTITLPNIQIFTMYAKYTKQTTVPISCQKFSLAVPFRGDAHSTPVLSSRSCALRDEGDGYGGAKFPCESSKYLRTSRNITP